MPAELVSDFAIVQLAAQVTPAMLRVLRLLRNRGFIQNGREVEKPVAATLKRLMALGLIDPGYSGPTNGEPFIWVSNGNGERVLRHLENSEEAPKPRINIHPRAATALSSLPERDQVEVLVAAESLLGRDPQTWPSEEAARLDPDKAVFLLRVSPELRAFVRLEEDGNLELFDILREETLRRFLERYPSGSGVG
jgi:hypothetical protein